MRLSVVGLREAALRGHGQAHGFACTTWRRLEEHRRRRTASHREGWRDSAVGWPSDVSVSTAATCRGGAVGSGVGGLWGLCWGVLWPVFVDLARCRSCANRAHGFKRYVATGPGGGAGWWGVGGVRRRRVVACAGWSGGPQLGAHGSGD